MNLNSILIVEGVRRFIGNDLKLAINPIITVLDITKPQLSFPNTFNLLDKIFKPFQPKTFSSFDNGVKTFFNIGNIHTNDSDPITVTLLLNRILKDDSTKLEIFKANWIYVEDLLDLPIEGINRSIVDLLSKYDKAVINE